MKDTSYQSWGRYPKAYHKDIKKVFWQNELPDFQKIDGTFLPVGYLKSYGDSCLNIGETLVDATGMNKLISFDQTTGILKCEAGVSLAEILDFSVPRGWFLASTPGTKYISVGGAVANDVHGKNHHKGGTFGCHVLSFELVKSTGERFVCSREQNPELFSATIGGLGLTGFITWVEFKLKKAPSAFFAMEAIKFNSIEEFFEINTDSEKDFDYTVSWIDTTATGKQLGRGIYNRGNHADPKDYDLPKLLTGEPKTFPLDMPFINSLSVKSFNFMYYNKQFFKKASNVVHYNPFFYPLDAVNDWNKAYGPDGFLQYQFVVPFGDDVKLIRSIMTKINESGMSSFLTVLKTFGNVVSPGMMSFPRPGITMAVDFRMLGETTLKVLRECDKLVRDAGGVLYPAKDARMAPEDFRSFYPQFEEFSKYIDPKISSSFWRRVMEKI